MKWIENAKKRSLEQQRSAKGAADRRAETLATVVGSTLGEEPRPYTRGAVMWTHSCSSMQAAYEELIVTAHRRGYDAVLGIGFTSPATATGGGHPGAHFIAYGTGVAWDDEPA